MTPLIAIGCILMTPLIAIGCILTTALITSTLVAAARSCISKSCFGQPYIGRWVFTYLHEKIKAAGAMPTIITSCLLVKY